MEKNVNNLSAEEFSKHFPVEVVPYDKNWPVLFQKEKEKLSQTLGATLALKIEHFGSTAIPGMSSKPIIDIIMAVPPLNKSLKSQIIEKMKEAGYEYFTRVSDRFSHIMFAKGYDLQGTKKQIYHVHMGNMDDSLWDRIYFRDYLLSYPEVQKEYEQLKLEMAQKHKHNRDGYSFAKTDFIIKITTLAKKERLSQM